MYMNNNMASTRGGDHDNLTVSSFSLNSWDNEEGGPEIENNY